METGLSVRPGTSLCCGSQASQSRQLGRKSPSCSPQSGWKVRRVGKGIGIGEGEVCRQPKGTQRAGTVIPPRLRLQPGHSAVGDLLLALGFTHSPLQQ